MNNRKYDAIAIIKGSRKYPDIRGSARFYSTAKGVLVEIYATGLPKSEGACDEKIFALHIHEGGACRGNAKDAFADALTHYNPGGCPHPYHAGDLPPLFGNDGTAWCAVLTNRFSIDDIIGKTVIIHSSLDDFTTQPSGNAGEKIACGVIKRR